MITYIIQAENFSYNEYCMKNHFYNKNSLLKLIIIFTSLCTNTFKCKLSFFFNISFNEISDILIQVVKITFLQSVRKLLSTYYFIFAFFIK